MTLYKALAAGRQPASPCAEQRCGLGAFGDTPRLLAEEMARMPRMCSTNSPDTVWTFSR